MWDALSDERMGLPFAKCCWPSPAQSFSGLSLFSELPMTRGVTVEAFETASTWVPRIILFLSRSWLCHLVSVAINSASHGFCLGAWMSAMLLRCCFRIFVYFYVVIRRENSHHCPCIFISLSISRQRSEGLNKFRLMRMNF
jgi:hypothetical protein